MWQSDNDDDGNKGVRINFVMEGGNYGYRDEMTGAGWRARRTNMENDIPLRHWHLNDPGVVPNLVQTYAGSPTGILVYEGKLLPAEYQNQVIHADARGFISELAFKRGGRIEPHANPNTTWSQVNPGLPATRILAYGPPPTSGYTFPTFPRRAAAARRTDLPTRS